MKAIFKLALTNIRHGKGAFKGIIILMAILTFSFTGTVSNDDNLERALDNNIERADIGDLTVHIYDDVLSDEMLECLEKSDNVERYRIVPALFYFAKPKIDGNEEETKIVLTRHDSSVRIFNDKYNGFKDDNSLENGGILLPFKLRTTKLFEIGSEITLKTTGGDETFIVKGYYEDPVYGSATNGDNYCVISEEDFDRIRNSKTDHITDPTRLLMQEDMIYIKGKGGIDPAALKRAVNEESDLINSANWASITENIKDNFKLYSGAGTKGMLVFTLLLLTVILITMYNSITSSVEMDQVNLGILKSQGFTSGKIRLVYLVQYILALTAGALLGTAVSIPVDSILIKLWMNITGLLTDTSVSFLKCAAVSLAIMVICTLFIFIATSKAARISPVRAISGGKSEVYFDSRLNTAIKQKHLSLTLALRHLNARRKSYIGIMLIVSLLMLFLVSILLLTSNLDPDKLFGKTGGSINILNKGGFDMSAAEQAEKDIKEIDSSASLYANSSHRMVVCGELMNVHSFVNSEDNFDLMEGTQPQFDNEIAITKAVSRDTGKTIGDTIEVSYQGKTEKFVITGYFQSIYDFGIVSMLTREGMEKMGYHDVNNAMVMTNSDADTEKILDMLKDKYSDKADISIYNEPQSIKMFKKITTILMDCTTATMYAIILIFASVIVVMTCTRSFTRERTDIGIFKAMGFTVNELRLQFALRFTFVAVTGAVLGSILSILCSEKMMNYILSAVGLTNFNVQYSVLTFISPALVLSVSFFIFSYLVSAKIKKVQVRELITE